MTTCPEDGVTYDGVGVRGECMRERGGSVGGRCECLGGVGEGGE